MHVCYRRLRGSLSRSLLILPFALLLACCAPHSAPAPAVPAVALPPPPPPPPVAPPTLRAAWSFHSGSDACIAVAKAGAASLQISVRPVGPIRLNLSLTRDIPEHPVARFNGPAGSWLMQGTRAGPRSAVFLLGRSDVSLSRVLLLLSGGRLRLESPENDLPILLLPESGTSGDDWFACARNSVI